MKEPIWIALLVTLFLTACSSEPQHSQATNPPLTTNDFGTAGFDRAKDIAARKGSGVVVVGDTSGSLDGVNKGSGDAFIRSYDSGGVLWAQQFGTRGFDAATDVVVTPTGISYVAGQTDGALGFKKGNTGTDFFLQRYNLNGLVQWTRQFGTSGFDNPFDIALDKSNNIYVLGQDANGTVIRKFNETGVLLQTITNPDPNILNETALAVDSTGNIIVLTRYKIGTKGVAKLLRYNSSGVLLDSPTVFDPSGSLVVFDLIIDGGDNLYISVLDRLSNQGGFVRKLSSTGATLWTARIEPTSTSFSASPKALALDKNNNLYIVGDTTDAYSGFSNNGLADIFVLKYSATGARLWVQQFGNGGSDLGSAIAVSDAVYVAGESTSNPNLLGEASHGSIDAYVAQLDSATGTLLGIDQ